MKNLLPYLTFDGNCREAMSFYERCFGGSLHTMTFGDSSEHFEVPPGAENRVMHAALDTGAFTLMASDSMPGMPFTAGNNVSVVVGCDSDDEVERLFGALTDGGNAVMPPADAFWGSYFAMCEDRFGIHWMLSHEKSPPPGSA